MADPATGLAAGEWRTRESTAVASADSSFFETPSKKEKDLDFQDLFHFSVVTQVGFIEPSQLYPPR